MRNKPGISLRGLCSQMALAALIADGIYRKYNVDGVITCGCDGLHMLGSRHYSGEALDFRRRDIKPDDFDSFVNDLREALGKEFDVIVHKYHIHVEVH